MGHITELDKMAFITSIEVALMKKGNINYNTVGAKLDAYYSCSFVDCYDHPEYLRDVLREVYRDGYDSILDKIKSELENLTEMEKEINEFLKIMHSPSK